MRKLPIDPEVWDAYAQFGGDLYDMQRRYNRGKLLDVLCHPLLAGPLIGAAILAVVILIKEVM